MGLDNGIYIRSKHREITRNLFPKEMIFPFKEDYDEGVEIVYWRKNWGLRNEVIHYLSPAGENNSGYYTIDTPSQIFDIISIIVSFMNKEKWEEDGDSIWDYDEILPILRQNIINLAIAAAFMQNNFDVYLLFYDSY